MCIHTYVYQCMYIHMHTYIYIYVCTSALMRICMHIETAARCKPFSKTKKKAGGLQRAAGHL